jgi:hypothetical protein
MQERPGQHQQNELWERLACQAGFGYALPLFDLAMHATYSCNSVVLDKSILAGTPAGTDRQSSRFARKKVDMADMTLGKSKPGADARRSNAEGDETATYWMEVGS